MTSAHRWMSLLAVLALCLAPASAKTLGNVTKTEMSPTSDLSVDATQEKKLQINQGEPEPQNELTFNVNKTTWTDAQLACEADSAALYTFDHSAQLDTTMIDFSTLYSPWVNVKKSGVENSSTQCSFLNASTHGKINLQFDDCLALHDFICQKPTSTPKTSIALAFKTDTIIPPRADRPYTELSQIIQNWVTLHLFHAVINQPLMTSALTQPNALTPADLATLAAFSQQTDPFLRGTMGGLIAMLKYSPSLSSSAMTEVTNKVNAALNFLSTSEQVTSTLTPVLGLRSEYQLAVIDFITQGKNFFNVLKATFVDPNVNPVITSELLLQLKGYLVAGQNQLVTAGTLLDTARTTTKILTSSLQQALTAVLAQMTAGAAFFGPLADAANPATMTPKEAGQLEAIQIQLLNLMAVGLPDGISMVAANPTLTTEQVQQVKEVLAQTITVNTAFTNVICSMGDDLNLNAAQVAALQCLMDEIIDVCTELFDAVGDPSVQPTISSGLLEDILEMTEQIGDVLDQVKGPLASTTTHHTHSTSLCHYLEPPHPEPPHPEPPHHTKPHHPNPLPHTKPSHHPKPPHHPKPRPPIRPPQGGHHHHDLSQPERHIVTSRIYALTGELEALLNLLRSPSVAQSTTSAQTETVINKLLKLRTREAEIEARLRTMPEQEQEELASKLEVAQGHLQKLVSYRSELDQHLTKTSESQLPITVFLNKIVDDLEPFF